MICGYASDPLAQLPLKWLMDKAAATGLVFCDQVVIDTAQVAPPISDSCREFAHGFYRFVSRRFYWPVGIPPEKGTLGTTTRINETIDGSVFKRRRVDENCSCLPPRLSRASGPRSSTGSMRKGQVPAHVDDRALRV